MLGRLRKAVCAFGAVMCVRNTCMGGTRAAWICASQAVLRCSGQARCWG